MKDYTRLCLQGASSIIERKKILEAKKEGILRQIEELKSSLEYINEKEKFYDDVLEGRREYVSNLLPCSCCK